MVLSTHIKKVNCKKWIEIEKKSTVKQIDKWQFRSCVTILRQLSMQESSGVCKCVMWMSCGSMQLIPAQAQDANCNILRASASSFLRAETISVPRLALQGDLLPYWKSPPHKKLTNSISMQSLFFAWRRPRGTLQCVATRQAKAKTINWSNRLNCTKGLNGTRDK